MLLANRSLEAQKPPPPEPPSLAGCWLTDRSQSEAALHRDFVQTDVLDGGPDNRETTGLHREHINLIGVLPNSAEQTFDGIGGLNMSVHRLRKLVERQGLLFLFGQASHRFWIALAIFGECSPPIGPRPPVGFRCCQMPTSSSATSARSRLGIVLVTLRCLCTRLR